MWGNKFINTCFLQRVSPEHMITLQVNAVRGSFSPTEGLWLAVETHRAKLETKLLVPLPKISHGDVQQGEAVGHGGVDLQHGPLLSRARLQSRDTQRDASR